MDHRGVTGDSSVVYRVLVWESTRLVWLARSGSVVAIADGLRDLDEIPLPEASPDFFIDYDETGPFSGEVGDSECAV